MGNNTTTWQNALKAVIIDAKELITLLELDPALLPQAQQVAKLFPLRVPQGFVARMKKGDVHDPLLKQILPIGAELQSSVEFTADPLQEKNVNPLPGLLHKYKNRVLLTVTSACAVNCRYCFRREFAYSDNNPGTKGYEKIMAYIAADARINEVILSGGDPLIATDDHLAALIQQLAQIDHIKLLRIHSRLPIVLPERITSDLIAVLKSTRLKTVMVLHCNHPNEIAEDVKHILQELHQAGITVLNQSVLLKDVNDNAKVLIELSEKLFAANVLPYYLYLLDKVNGTQHFEVEESAAKAIHWEMMQHLSGYLVPRLVREVPGAPAKIPVFNDCRF